MENISAKNISVVINNTPLINNVSLKVNAGEVAAVIGSNGAGKTTLIKALSGEIKTGRSDYKIKGEICLCEKSIDGWQESDKARHLAFLPQLSALSFPFTVEEVIQLGRIPHATGVRIDQQIIHEALALLDITHLKTRLYTQLSGGEKQRVQLARVMSQIWREEDAGRRVLILDEPSSSLDLGHQQQLMSVIRSFADQGVAIIVVAHDVNLITHHVDQILGLCCGEVVAHGPPEKVITSETMKTLYQVDMEVISHPGTKKPIVV